MGRDQVVQAENVTRHWECGSEGRAHKRRFPLLCTSERRSTVQNCGVHRPVAVGAQTVRRWLTFGVAMSKLDKCLEVAEAPRCGRC